MRWTPGKGLEAAYRLGPNGEPEQAIVLSAPTCAGHSISISELIGTPGVRNKEIPYVALIAADGI